MFIPKEDTDTEWYDGGYDGEISDGEISDGEISDTEDLYFSDDDDDDGKKNIFLKLYEFFQDFSEYCLEHRIFY